jgi:hypothetical protein
MAERRREKEMIKQITTGVIVVVLFAVVITQNVIMHLSLRNVYSDLASRTAGIKFEVKDLQTTTAQELTETRRAAELTRTDNASQEAYTQSRVKSLSDYVSKQRQLEIKQTKDISDTLLSFGEQLRKFDDQLYRLDKQAKEQKQDVADSKETFYKALYVMCLDALKDKVTGEKLQHTCREVVKELEGKEMFDQPAPGWVWPLVGSGGLTG